MEAVVFHSRTLIRFPNLVSFRRRPIFALKDIADGYPSKSIQLSVSSNGQDGNAGHRPPRRSSAPGRTRKNESSSRKTGAHKNEEDLRNNPKSNNQEEIIALFRKIQTSIAKESANTDDNEDSHKDEYGTESILETLRESKKQVKGKTSKKAGAKVLRRKGTSEEKEMHHTLPAAEFKLVRPPSKFVKRSPIPSPAGGNGSHLTVEVSQAIAESGELKFPSIENMKLTELKALAKSRGIKGYSKLKKSELLKLLES